MYNQEAQKIIAASNPIPGAFAAGGAVTSVFTASPIRDVDVYFKTVEAFEQAVASAYDNGFWCVGSSKRAVTFSDRGSIVQFMHFGFFPTAQDIFDAFDFTVVMGAYDYDTGDFVLHGDFMRHNAQRFLRFNPRTRFPLASATRVLKYQQRGYTIGKGDILKIALACRGVTIETWDNLKDQIGGAYGDKVALDGDGKPFTLEAAIESLSTNEDGSEPWIASAANDNQPKSAVELLRHIAELKGDVFSDSHYDADGFRIEVAAA